MNFGVVGVSYKNTSIDIREKFFLDDKESHLFCQTLQKNLKLKDILILSTCNRTEIYFDAPATDQTGVKIWQILMDKKNINACPIAFSQLSKNSFIGGDLKPNPFYFYHYSDLAAVNHLLRVASSLDSLVVGESQILGQVKKSLEKAIQSTSLSAHFLRTFEFAIHAAKKVRTETGIADHYTSIGHVAVDLANSIFTDLKTKTALVIGAGEIASLVVAYLKQVGIGKITITNRTLSRSMKVSKNINSEVLPFDLIQLGLESADIVISSINTKEALLSAAMISRVMEDRKYRTLFILDLGMPRNIDAQAAGIDNFYLFNIDDLVKVANKNRQLRLKEVEQANNILAKEMLAYQNWLADFDERHIISLFRESFEDVYIDPLTNSILNLDIDITHKTRLLSSVRKVSQKILHPLTKYIRDNKSESAARVKSLCQALDLSLTLQSKPDKSGLSKSKKANIIKIDRVNDKIKSRQQG